MLTRTNKNIFLSIITLSIAVYTTDDYDNVDREKIVKKNLVYNSSTTTEVAASNTEKLEESPILDFEKIADSVQEKADQSMTHIFNSETLLKRLSILPKVKNDEVIELKIDKIGLGAAVAGSSLVLAFNRFINLENIRKSPIYRKALGLSSACLIYKLVATNDVVKQNICETLSKLKKD